MNKLLLITIYKLSEEADITFNHCPFILKNLLTIHCTFFKVIPRRIMFSGISTEFVVTILSLSFIFFVLNMAKVLQTFRGILSETMNSFHGVYRSSAIVHAVGRYASDNKAPKGLPTLTKFEKVSDGTYRILGLNPGSHTLQGTNTWLIAASSDSSFARKNPGQGHILVDTGEDVTATKYIDFLFEEVFPATGTKSISSILLTHGHGDHQGGVVALLAKLRERNMLPLPTIYKRTRVKGGRDQQKFPCRGFECENIEDHQVFSVDEQTTIKALYTPGHTDDHVSFLLERDNAVLSGDCVLGCGTAVFDNLFEYMHSLTMLRSMIIQRNKNPRKSQHILNIYPGHGPVITNALEKIDEYIQHRNLRERQIVELLNKLRAEGTSGLGWISTWSLVGEIYGELPLFIKFSAQWNLSHHLEKLKIEGRVEQRWGLWRATEAGMDFPVTTAGSGIQVK